MNQWLVIGWIMAVVVLATLDFVLRRSRWQKARFACSFVVTVAVLYLLTGCFYVISRRIEHPSAGRALSAEDIGDVLLWPYRLLSGEN